MLLEQQKQYIQNAFQLFFKIFDEKEFLNNLQRNSQKAHPLQGIGRRSKSY